MIQEKFRKLSKLLLVLCASAGICSLVMFIPHVREIIIALGEKYLGRALNHALWNAKLIIWEIQFLILLFVSVFLLSDTLISRFPTPSEKTYKICSWVFVAVSSIFLLIIACESEDIWLDETFSLGLARHSVKDLISLTAQDVHPPLYYLILKSAVMIFLDSVAAAKIVSVIPVILIMCFANIFFFREFSAKFALLFNSVLISTLAVLQYAVEIRMYSWCMLFSLLCAFFSYYIVKKGDLKYFLLYVLFAECGAYCQYWTAFALAVNFVLISALCFFKDKKSLSKILVSALIGIVAYMPWAGVVIRQVSEVSASYWIAPITVKTFLTYILSVVPAMESFKLAFLAVLAYFFIKSVLQIMRQRKDFQSWFLLISFGTPILLIICATIISLAMRPVFIARYAVPLIMFIIFFFVLVFTKEHSKKLFAAFLFNALVGSILSIKNQYDSEKTLSYENKKFTNMMAQNRTKDTVFIFGEKIDSHIPHCIAYSYPDNRIYGFDISELWTSAYFYNRKNLIASLADETDLCLVITKDEEVPPKFKDVQCMLVNLSIYPNLKFYFLK